MHDMEAEFVASIETEPQEIRRQIAGSLLSVGEVKCEDNEYQYRLDELQCRLDGLIAAECSLTGNIMIESVDHGFRDSRTKSTMPLIISGLQLNFFITVNKPVACSTSVRHRFLPFVIRQQMNSNRIPSLSYHYYVSHNVLHTLKAKRIEIPTMHNYVSSLATTGDDAVCFLFRRYQIKVTKMISLQHVFFHFSFNYNFFYKL